MKKIISRGAEAIIHLEDGKVIKERLKKGYRIPELDKKIIKRRTKAETKLLKKASELINSPSPRNTEKENEIIIPFIEGDKLSEKLNSYSQKKQIEVMKKIGIEIGKLHKGGIIHGDLTTSNMILVKKPLGRKEGERSAGGRGDYKEKVYIIDFGLGSFNGKYEQKGVDIHLLKEALEAKHFENHKKLFSAFESGYKSIDETEAKKVFERLITIEKRGRYRH